LGQCERGDLAAREARQVLLLLLGRAEHLERLRYADRLVCGQQHTERSSRRADDRDRLVVAALAETEAAVLLRDLDAERAQTAQSVDYVFRDLARALDRLAVDRLRELVEPAMELGSTLLLVGVLRWWRVDQIEAETSKEQLTNEARQHPLGLPRGLRDLACLALIDRARPGL